MGRTSRAAAIAALLCSACAAPAGEEGKDGEDDATVESAATVQAIALVGETASGLRPRIEQWGQVADPSVTLKRPAVLSLSHRDGTLLAFRVPGDPSSHVRGPFDFYAHGPHLGITVITRRALEEHYGSASAGVRAFVEAFGEAAYGDRARVAAPALINGWNGLVLVSELAEDGTPAQTTAESIHFRKVKR
ncbi:MAG: hypothetical protein KIT84_26360 [Labilithrix sp.]|nr:hypothetical protein [Labilithrix sp.]MCW5814579.1 hypothetical protein [Labilithrix sp.]